MMILIRIKNPITKLIASIGLSVLLTFDVIERHLPKLRPPRPVILVSYLYIVYTVVATIIMIASQNLLVGVVLFGLFVVPLYAMIAYTRRLAKRYQTIRYHFIQNVQGEYNG